MWINRKLACVVNPEQRFCLNFNFENFFEIFRIYFFPENEKLTRINLLGKIVCRNKEIIMKKILVSACLGFALVGSAFAIEAAKPADTSIDGIFSALTNSRNLQKTVDQLIASGANHHSVISIAAAAGIPQSKIMKLQVCVNSVSADSTTLGATCMRPKTVVTAYESGLNDPLAYLPATAAGKKAKK